MRVCASMRVCACIHNILLMVVAIRVNCTGSDGTPSPAPVDATTTMKYDPGSNPMITSLLSVALTVDERITIVDDSLITRTVYISNIPLINSGGSHDTLIELKETLSTVTFLVALGAARKHTNAINITIYNRPILLRRI